MHVQTHTIYTHLLQPPSSRIALTQALTSRQINQMQRPMNSCVLSTYAHTPPPLHTQIHTNTHTHTHTHLLQPLSSRIALTQALTSRQINQMQRSMEGRCVLSPTLARACNS